MAVGSAKDLASLTDMSDVSDIAQWCVSRGHYEVMLQTRRPNLGRALREAGIEVTDGPASLSSYGSTTRLVTLRHGRMSSTTVRLWWKAACLSAAACMQSR